jgi:hypothetical protein
MLAPESKTINQLSKHQGLADIKAASHRQGKPSNNKRKIQDS